MGHLIYLGEAASTSVDLSGLTNALTTSITPADIITILSSVVGVGMAFVLMWFGIRKVAKIFTNALSKGKLQI